jgi:hypothetical protein
MPLKRVAPRLSASDSVFSSVLSNCRYMSDAHGQYDADLSYTSHSWISRASELSAESSGEREREIAMTLTLYSSRRKRVMARPIPLAFVSLEVYEDKAMYVLGGASDCDYGTHDGGDEESW